MPSLDGGDDVFGVGLPDEGLGGLVLLLDEVGSGLDQDNALLVERLVRKYLDGSGGAALWVSHNPEHLERVATIFITMHQDGLQIRKENDLISP